MADDMFDKARRLHPSDYGGTGGQQPLMSQTSQTATRRGGQRTQPQTPQIGNSVEDINALFEGMRNMPTPQGFRRPMVRRGMSGAVLDANGQDPGSGFNQFQRNNPHLATPELRQQQFQQEADQRMNNIRNQGAAAVEERKMLQGMGLAPFQQEQQQQDANKVVGSDGYMTMFTPEGRIAGTNRPMDKVGNGFGDPTNTTRENQVGSQAFQQAANQSFLDNYPNVGGVSRPQSNLPPSGGNVGGTVGAPARQGAPGGGTSVVDQPANAFDVGQIPGKFAGLSKPIDAGNIFENGMKGAIGIQAYGMGRSDKDYFPLAQNVPQGSPTNPFTTDPFTQDNQDGSFVGPQLQYNSPDQLSALNRLQQFSRGTSPGPAALEAKWNNIFPNQPDYAYLQQLFPNVFNQNDSIYHAMKQLFNVAQSPEYVSQY